jgi:ATP-dependent 26S proteasome regulatory subunit
MPFLQDLLAMGEHAPSVEQKVDLAQAIRGRSADRSRKLDHVLFEQLSRLGQGLSEAQAHQEKLSAILEDLSSTPFHPATFLRPVTTALGPRAMVTYGGARRVVGLAEGVDLNALATGDEVLLGKDLNVVMGKSSDTVKECGETGFFQRFTSDGRIVLKWRDEEIVVEVARSLQGAELNAGDQVRWDRTAWVAFERIDRAPGRQFLLDQVPDVGRDQVGGQDVSLDTLLSALTAALVAPEKAARYGLGGRHSVLMVGPPGCGKTLMARVAAAEVTRVSGRRCRFGVVKPAEWESPWVGETQQNIRNCFEALRDAAANGCAVLFLDEIESVGRIRGGAVGQHSDKFLAALLAELDGFTDRSGVAIIAATNRKDLVDPALLERLSDMEIAVRRPDMRGAKAIFDIHLPESLPYSPNGKAAWGTRGEIIAAAVSRFYSPNADNELCVVRFRDGKTRTVAARELASGRIFRQICRAACQEAFLRDLRAGDPGLRVLDVERALADAFERLASTLTARNAHAYLPDLPQDVDVVSVEPVVRKVARPHRYVNAA